jgi:TonB family protein
MDSTSLHQQPRVPPTIYGLLTDRRIRGKLRANLNDARQTIFAAARQRLYVKDQIAIRLVRWVAFYMAHRPMPKPDPAGRLFPVKPPPASNISQQPPSPDAKPIRARNTRDYWEMILCALVIAATVFVVLRIGTVLWDRSEHPQNKPATASSPLANTTTPTIPRKIQASPSSEVSLSREPASHSVRPKTERTPNDSVVIQAIVGTDGKVKQARILRGNPTLAPAALQTVRQLSFNPYAPNGTAVEFETEVVVSQPGIRKNPNESLQISIPQNAAAQPTSAP